MPTNSNFPETVTAEVELAIGARRLHAKISLSTVPTRLPQLLPIVHAIADATVAAAVEDVESQGRRVSCRKGCAMCCRHLVPVAEPEARRLRDLMEELPEPRRTAVRARFAEALGRLENVGLLARLRDQESESASERKTIGFQYLQQHIACPFLEDEICSIYSERPLSCREYVVTSPAENCALPTRDGVQCVPMPINVWRAVYSAAEQAQSLLPSVPLILALEWADKHPDTAPDKSGPEILRQILENLSGKAVPRPEAPNSINDQGA